MTTISDLLLGSHFRANWPVPTICQQQQPQSATRQTERGPFRSARSAIEKYRHRQLSTEGPIGIRLNSSQISNKIRRFWESTAKKQIAKLWWESWSGLPGCLLVVGRKSDKRSKSISVFISVSKAHISIPYICHLFYTTTFYGLKMLHSKVQKFATKIASRQNSVNLRQNYLTTKIT